MGVYRGYSLDNVTINSGTANFDSLSLDGVAVPGGAPVSVTTSTVAVTAADHAGKLIVLNRAAGVTATLPAATGTGNTYRFSVGTAVTSNADIIKVANATDVLSGALVVASQGDGATATSTFATTSSSDTISMNGTTTGGLRGGLITIVDIAAGFFSVTGVLAASGSEATPFSATVS